QDIRSTLFPYTTLFRSRRVGLREADFRRAVYEQVPRRLAPDGPPVAAQGDAGQPVLGHADVESADGDLMRHPVVDDRGRVRVGEDRKSTRLNSSHVKIS